MRVRENSEQIALLQGEHAERERLLERFSRVVDNWYGIMSRTKRLTAFTASYSQAAVIFPYMLVAPAYFANKIQLGGLTQTAYAFGSVQEALSFFVSIYRTLAEWRAVVARLDGFETSIAGAEQLATDPASICIVPASAHEIALRNSWSGCPTARRWSRPTAFQPARRRTHAGHRPLRRRQVDAVPRHRRHLAVRRAARSRSRPTRR